MKTFYTERDIVDMHKAGVTQIEVNDNVVLTDLARDKAADLGIQLKPVDVAQPPPVSPHPPISPSPATPPTKKETKLSNDEIVARVKAGVIAKLGSTEYNDLLDQVIPQVLARLTSGQPSAATNQSATRSAVDGYGDVA